MLVDLIQKETTREAVRMQATTWIKFRKEAETLNLAFNSRMLAAYRLNDIDELVNGMTAHILEQVQNPALRDSGFAVDEVIETNVDFHRLNLTLFDMGGHNGPQNVFDHCAQTLRRRKLKLGDF